MTKEECIALLIRYAEYDGMGIPNLAGCKEAMRMAAKLLSQPQPSLPSNLDEAANKYGFKETLERLKEGEITRKNEGMFRWQIEKSFKAGAEWMAGQGVTKDGLVAAYDNGCLRVYTTILDKEDGIKFGDKVVVQIRKK